MGSSITWPATTATLASTNTATYARCAGIYIGVSDNYELCFDGTNWIVFNGTVAGTVLPTQVLGVRAVGGAAVDSGDVVFLY